MRLRYHLTNGLDETLQDRGGGADRFARNGLRGLRRPLHRPAIMLFFK
jgi:hypothetical protein